MSGLTRERAIQALANHDGDAVEAILELEGAIDYKGNNLLLAGEPEPAAMTPVQEEGGGDGAADDGGDAEEGGAAAEAEARQAREDRAAELPPMTPRCRRQ